MLNCSCEMLNCSCEMLRCSCELLNCSCEMLNHSCDMMNCSCEMLITIGIWRRRPCHHETTKTTTTNHLPQHFRDGFFTLQSSLSLCLMTHVALREGCSSIKTATRYLKGAYRAVFSLLPPWSTGLFRTATDGLSTHRSIVSPIT
jgi:hypothetical protein